MLKRLIENHTVHFLRVVSGLSQPATSVSSPESELLASLARGRTTVVEVGVFEGATSQLLCKTVGAGGTVYLVDPFFPTVRLERLLNVSFNQIVASRAVRQWNNTAKFVRMTSRDAAETFPPGTSAGFIFIDARHDYESVREDFQVWAPKLAPDGAMAFHDSRVCPPRPDIDESTGPVRLMREIAAGVHGPWQVVATADSVTVIKRAAS